MQTSVSSCLFLVIFLAISNAISAKDISILETGAIGDGKTINTHFIQDAIDKCASSGGGTITVPPGHFLTGTLHLKSNTHLYLFHGSLLQGSSKLSDYKAFDAPGYGKYYYGILFTENAENILISGSGRIDGNDSVFFDWTKAKKLEWGATKFARQGDAFRKVESGIGDGPILPFDRPRQMVIFSNCRNITVKDIQLTGSPFWTLHFADCDGVVADGLRVFSSLFVPNADGVDFTSCSNVVVSNCDIRTGDDALVISGYAHHYELPGYKNLRHPSANFVVTNCNLQSASSAIRIGFMDQNDISNIQISNINITNSTRGINIALRDEGSISNVSISNVYVETKFRTGDWWGNGEPIQISAIRGKENVTLGTISNIRLKNITCMGENGILVYGSNESIISDVVFEDVRLTIYDGKHSASSGGNIDLRGTLRESEALFASDTPGWYLHYVANVRMENCSLQWDKVIMPWFTHALKADFFTNLKVRGFMGTSSPVKPSLAPVVNENGKGWLFE